MKRTDGFLIILVAGVVLLIVGAFVLLRLQPPADYRPGSDPADVAHNYLFALQQEDYERAYTYLSPSMANYPRKGSDFSAQVFNNGYAFVFNEYASLTVGEADIQGNRATVPVRQRIAVQGGLFGGGSYDYDFQIRLERDGPDGPWLLVGADQFWLYCWGQAGASC